MGAVYVFCSVLAQSKIHCALLNILIYLSVHTNIIAFVTTGTSSMVVMRPACILAISKKKLSKTLIRSKSEAEQQQTYKTNLAAIIYTPIV